MNIANDDKYSSVKEIIRYIIPGNPIPLARARHGRSRTWDSQKENKLITGLNIARQHGNREMYSGPLYLFIEFYLYIPRSYRKKSYCLKPHCHKPDISNLIKYIEDVATGILYVDDSQIASISSKKLYDNDPRTEFYIVELNKI